MIKIATFSDFLRLPFSNLSPFSADNYRDNFLGFSLYVLAYIHSGNSPVVRRSSIFYHGLIKNRMFEDLKQ